MVTIFALLIVIIERERVLSEVRAKAEENFNPLHLTVENYQSPLS